MESGTDVLRLQFRHERIPADLRRIDPHYEKVPGMGELIPDRIRQRTDLRHIGQQLPIPHRQRTPLRIDLSNARQLADADRCADVGEIVFETGMKHFCLRRTPPVLPVERIHADAVKLPDPDRIGQFRLSVTNIPPSPVVTFLIAWNE